MVNVLKFQTLFFINFQIEILVIRTEIHKMLVGIAYWEGPDQKKSDLGLAVCLGLFGRQLVYANLEHVLKSESHNYSCYTICSEQDVFVKRR